MAFTEQQIEKAFKDDPHFSYFHQNFFSHPNYPVVVDYLTGRSSTLQALTQTHENYALQALLPLLQNVEVPAETDRLLLDVLYHPDVLPQVHYQLVHTWVQYLLLNDTGTALQAVTGLCQRAGLQRQDLVENVIAALLHVPNAEAIVRSSASPLKTFLLQNLPPKLSYSPYHPYRVSGDWNRYYLLLMEEAQPQLVQDYLKQGLLSNRPGIIQGILHTGNGRHLPFVLGWIKHPSVSQSEMQSKFFAAIQLYEAGGDAYEELVRQAAEDYLREFRSFSNKDRWENGLHLKEFENTDYSYLGYSAAAAHVLLRKNPALVKDTITDWFQHNVFVPFHLLRMLHFHLKEDALPYLQQGLNATGGISHYRSIVNLLAEGFRPEVYLDTLWKLAGAKSKPLRELIAKIIIENDKDAERKAIGLLENKNAETRQTGALILSSFATETAVNAVKALLDKEANDATRDLLLSIVKEALPPTADAAFLSEMIASAKGRGKLAKPVEAWLNESSLPPLFYRSGDPLTAEELRFLLYRMSRVKAMRSDAEARYLIENLDREKAAPFAKHILKLYTDKGATPEQKYLLALAALLDNEDVVDKIRTLTNGWIEAARGKMAEYGVGALALQGSNKALRWVEWYSRTYKNKKANVGAAALQALEDAAEEQGITVHELGDRVVPDFGFDGLYKEFGAGAETCRAFIDGNFKLCFFGEEGKKFKAVPAGTPAAIKEEFKAIGKEVRDVVKSQSGRMEHYLLVQRRWPAAAWKSFFLNNPVMFIYATKLLWGVYKGDRVVLPFLCLEDTSLINIDDEEIDLEDDEASVGIVHPLHLSEEERQPWKRKFFDLSIEPVFPQLERTVSVVKADEAEQKIVRRFEEKETGPGAIKTTLERYGWRKGDAGDGGHIDSFWLSDDEQKIKAVMEVDGVFAGGYDYGGTSKLGRLYFINPQKEAGRWFQQPKDEKDERLIALKDVPPVFYSEVMLNVGNIKLKSEAKEG